ncbi:MAG: hypothetical protein AB8B85_03510 [Paracoccaceae bacterium]
MSGAVRFRAFSYVAKGYALALLVGLCLVLFGVDTVPALLAMWLGGAVLTLGLAAMAVPREAARVPVKATQQRLRRGYQRH